jgi:hypothetical protein
MILQVCILLVATLGFLAIITDWFKKRIPISCGFLFDEKIVDQLLLYTGDEAKKIILRFINKGETTLTGVILDIRFLKPLVLSATGTALIFYRGKPEHGRVEDGSYYMIKYSELIFLGKEKLDSPVELNTKGQLAGTYKVVVTIYSTQHEYKLKKSELLIKIN